MTMNQGSFLTHRYSPESDRTNTSKCKGGATNHSRSQLLVDVEMMESPRERSDSYHGGASIITSSNNLLGRDDNHNNHSSNNSITRPNRNPTGSIIKDLSLSSPSSLSSPHSFANDKNNQSFKSSSPSKNHRLISLFYITVANRLNNAWRLLLKQKIPLLIILTIVFISSSTSLQSMFKRSSAGTYYLYNDTFNPHHYTSLNGGARKNEKNNDNQQKIDNTNVDTNLNLTHNNNNFTVTGTGNRNGGGEGDISTRNTDSGTGISRWKQREILHQTIFDTYNRQKTSIKNDNNNSNDQQQMVILAGPQLTNINAIQKKLWSWTIYNSTQKYSKPILPNWVWPIPLPIADAEFAEIDEGDWTPADVYYPIFELMKMSIMKKMSKTGEYTGKVPKPPTRLLFQKYSPKAIFKMVQDIMEEQWDLGYNLIFGTEAFSNLVTYPLLQDEFIEWIQTKLLPKSIIDDQITVVILYQTPKSDRLYTLWNLAGSKDSFREWIGHVGGLSFTYFKELGIVQAILEKTKWNVALIDTKGLEEYNSNNWDISNFIACHIMKNNKCDKYGTMVGFDNKVDTWVKFPPSIQRPSSIGDMAVNKMEEVFMTFDCKYKIPIQKHIHEGGRLKLYHSSGFDKTMKYCDSMAQNDYFDTYEMKDRIEAIVRNYGGKR